MGCQNIERGAVMFAHVFGLTVRDSRFLIPGNIIIFKNKLAEFYTYPVPGQTGRGIKIIGIRFLSSDHILSHHPLTYTDINGWVNWLDQTKPRHLRLHEQFLYWWWLNKTR